LKFNYIVLIGGFGLYLLPFLLNSLGASSWALGTFLGAFTALAAFFLRFSRLPIQRKPLYAFTSFVVVNIAVTSVYFVEPPTLEQLLALPVGLLLVIYSCLLGYCLRSIPTVRLNRYIYVLVYCSIGLSLLMLALRINLLPNPKSILFFSEPSHLAVGLAPFVTYVMLSSARAYALIVVLLLCILALWIENVTLLALVIPSGLILFLRFRVGVLISLSLAAVFLSFLFTFALRGDYFASRLFLDSQNISSLVYLRGIESAEASLRNPPYIGVGFQMMDSRSPRTPAVELLEGFKLDSLNASDGGMVFSKLVCEFGWPGLALLICFFVVAIPKAYSCLLLAANSLSSTGDNIFVSCFIGVCIQLFVRGSGYLSPFLVLASLVYFFMPTNGVPSSELTRWDQPR
jgi:hypothetical protein